MSRDDEFKAVFRMHPAGVALITAIAGHEEVALTASSLSAVSADPPMVMFSISRQSSSIPVLEAADSAVVHLLSAGNQDLAELGALSGIDRFADTWRWSYLHTGEPVFRGVPAWLRVDIARRLPAGEAVVFLAEVQSMYVDGRAEDHDGLVYRNKSWHRIEGAEMRDTSRLIVTQAS